MLVTSSTSVEFRLLSTSRAFSFSVPLDKLKGVAHVVVSLREGLFSKVIVHKLRFAWDPDVAIVTFELPADDVCQELRLLRSVWNGNIKQSNEWRQYCAAVGTVSQPSPYLMALTVVP